MCRTLSPPSTSLSCCLLPGLLCWLSRPAQLKAAESDVRCYSIPCQCLPDLQDVQVLSSAEYFTQYWAHVPVVLDLHDSIQQSRQAAAVEGSPSRSAGGYKPHLSAHTLEQALNSGNATQVCKPPDIWCILPRLRVGGKLTSNPSASDHLCVCSMLCNTR